jgi:hypothetical protein
MFIKSLIDFDDDYKKHCQKPFEVSSLRKKRETESFVIFDATCFAEMTDEMA